MTSEATVKKDIQKLQRAIVDGLEDVKAQDIQVFNTESLSPLFERVIIATGTSNRQTKALAASVRDAVREAGFPKPRMEGEEVGEWIIVDCGQAVAHIMQPAIRQYYHLEDLWGEKPVRLKLGAAKPAARPAQPQAEPAAPTSLKRSSAAKKGVAALPARAQDKAAAAKKAAPKSSAKSSTSKTAGQAPAGKAGSKRPLKVVKVNAPKPAAKKAAARKSAAPAPAKAAAKQAPARKSASRKG